MRDCIKIPRILLPDVKDMTKWSVIACDQFTSDRKYWERLRDEVGDAPSTLKLILPEVYLGDSDVEERIASAFNEMRRYVAEEILKPLEPGFILVERLTAYSQTPRYGIMLSIDLEEFSTDGAKTAIRPSEATVAERIPARMRIRRGAPIELPHSILLYNDRENSVLGDIIAHKDSYKKVYDFPLLMNGGTIKGYFIPYFESLLIKEKFYALAERAAGGLLFVVGDGNHAFASAKKLWDERGEDHGDEPARYFLTEAVNICDSTIKFGSIHRLVRVRDKKAFLTSLETYVGGFTEKNSIIRFNGFYNIADCITRLDNFVKAYIGSEGGSIDFISGEGYLKRLVERSGDSLGIIINPMDKAFLFSYVADGGVLPQKTFSLGESIEKRYYLEAKKI